MEQMPKWLLLNAQVVRSDGTYDLEKDKLAAKEYFLGHVNKKTVFFHTLKEKLDYLVEENYYEKDFLDQYSYEEIKEVFRLAYSFKFRFPTYMGAFKFYNDYALKTNDNENYLERYEDRMSIVALYHADGDVEKAKKLVTLLMKQTFTPATPTLLNTGRKRRGEFVSCFLLSIEDSLNGISKAVDFSMQLSKRAGGVSLNVSNIRAQGEVVKDIEGVSKGPVAVMKLLDNAFRYANQLGQRNGSGAAYLSIFHADFEQFLSTRKINADDDIRMKTLSIGAIIPDKFVQLAKEGKHMYQFYPKNIWDNYGEYFEDITANMDEWYDKLVADKNIKKKQVSPRKLLQLIAATQGESGYPYLMFIDNANKAHAVDGQIKFSNLCSEILQQSGVSVFNDYGSKEQDTINYGISCNLASGHMENMIETNTIKETVFAAMDIMTSVSDKTNIYMVPEIAKANSELHSVGFGIMGHHGFAAKNEMMIGDEDNKEFLDVFFNMINYYTLLYSNQKAKEKEEVFKGFELSKYSSGEYFDGRGAIVPTRKKVAAIFENIYIPTDEDWNKLRMDVMEYGLYHAYRQAVAPTGSISYVMSATASLTPIKSRVEERTYGNSKTYFPMPHLDTHGYMYETMYEIDNMRLIDAIAVVQKHVDQGISFELGITSDKTTKDLQKYYMYAHHKGIKTLYYTRVYKKDITELDNCVACVV